MMDGFSQMTFPLATWWGRLFGIRPEEIPEDARLEFIFTNAPQSWGVFVLLAIVSGLVYTCLRMYRSEAGQTSLRIRNFLMALRIAVLLLVALVFLGPAITFTRQLRIEPHIYLLRDASGSMAIVDRFQEEADAKRAARVSGQSVSQVRSIGPRRSDLVDRVINPEMVQELQKKGKLRVYDFADDLELVNDRAQTDEDDDEVVEDTVLDLPPLIPEGPATDLYLALRKSLADQSASGIIAFTDGQNTSAASLEPLARDAKNKGVPLMLVGVGDPVPPRNLQVVDLQADSQVWLNDPFEIRALLRTQGVGGETVSVDLLESPLTDASEAVVLESRDVTLADEDGSERILFSHKPTKPGKMSYNIRVKPVDNESNLEDNQTAAPAVVNILDESARVLLIAGRAMWEYRALQTLLTREKFIDLSCWLQTLDPQRVQPGNTTIRRLPSSKAELFEYDVVLLLDPDPARLDPEWVKLLKRFAREHAGGILYMAGPRFAGRFLSDPNTSIMKDILPVRLGDIGSMEVSSLLSLHNQRWPLGVIRASVDHPVMNYYQETETNYQRWKSLPGIYWSFPAVEAKPAAQVLVNHSNPNFYSLDVPRPLLITGQYGSGRTVYVGFNGTWLWRGKGQDNEFYNRYWVQLVRYLVRGRALEAEGRGYIESEKDTWHIGDQITLNARLRDEHYDNLEAEQVAGVVQPDEGDPMPLTFHAIPGQSGEYQAGFLAREVGLHRVKVELGVGTEDVLSIEKELSIIPPNLETRATWMKRQTLKNLASLSGGQYFEIDETKKLADAVPNRVRTIETQSPARPVWDNASLLMILVILLGLEWALRKRFKLL